MDAIESGDGRAAGSAMIYGIANRFVYGGTSMVVFTVELKEWAIYKPGRKRYNLTEKMTESSFNEFREYVKKHGGCKCKCYFNANK